jgi:ABC-type Fe3+ transport system permease subunit
MEAYTAIMMSFGAVLVIGVLALLVLLRTLARDRQALQEREGQPPRPAAAPALFSPAGLTHPPIGTLLILLVYLLLIVGLWGSIYLTMLRRG